MVQSANDTADGFFEVLAYVDNDDKYKHKYPDWVKVGDPMPLAPAYQSLYELSSYDIIMMCADDIVFKTPGWDTKVKELMPKDGIGLVSYDDLGRPRKEDGHPFIGRRFIETVGYLCYPKLKHSCIDNWYVDIAKSVNRYFYSDIVIEHLHPKYKKGEWDDTYSMNSKIIKKEDGIIYLGPEGKSEIKKAVERVSSAL